METKRLLSESDGGWIDGPTPRVKPTYEHLAIQTAILVSLRRYSRRSAISTNQVIAEVRRMTPEHIPDERELGRLIREAAMLLGLIPVYDPSRSE